MLEPPEGPSNSSHRAEVPGGLVPAVPAGAGPVELADSLDHGLFGALPPSTHGPSAALSVSMLLRTKWLILGIFVFMSALTVPCVWVFVAPKYAAQAVIRVSPVISRIVFRTEDNGIVPLYHSYLNTQVSVIQSPTVLQRVLDREEVRKTRWYDKDAYSPLSVLRGPRSLLERLKADLSIRPRRNTELIDVSMTALDPKEATLIVDTVVDEYKRLNDEELRESGIRRLETLTSERSALQREIDGLVATKFNLSKRLGTTSLEELRSQFSSHLSSLEADEDRLHRELAMTQWELDTLDSSATVEQEREEGDGEEVESDHAQKRYVADSEWRRLNIALEMTRHQLELARQRYGEAHPRIAESLADVNYADRVLRERETQLDQQGRGVTAQLVPAPDGVVTFIDRATLDRQVQRLQREGELIGDEIEDQRKKVAEAGSVAQDIAHYNEEIRHKRELYDAVRSRLSELEMESKATARISVSAHAIQPTQPYRDRRILLTVMALGCALMMGLAAGYVRTATDPKIREAGDVRYALRVPFLGQLPPLPSTTDLMADCGRAVTESVRMLRTALLERLTDSGKRIILLTSSSSQAGKTSVAILLARSLAQLGKRTLLVEVDLHRPTLSSYLNLEPNPGLIALLTGSLDDRETIVSMGVDKFDVLPVGERTNDADSELLANGAFAACLDRWKKSYDFVLLDGPPFLPVADARILAGQADGTIMVLRAAHCRRNEAIHAYANLSAGGGALLGTVLVGDARAWSGYGYYGDYQAYYSSPRALKA